MSIVRKAGIDGFSLLEMLVVLSIVALIFGVSALGLSTLANRSTPAKFAKEIADLLNEVHRRSFTRHRTEVVIIDLVHLRVTDRNTRRFISLPNQYKLRVTIGRETVKDKDRLELVFLPDGTSSGARFEITNGTGLNSSLEVSWLTGMARRLDVVR